MVSDLEAVKAIYEQFFETNFDPEAFAEERSVERDASNMENVAKWRAWQRASLDETIALSDAALDQRPSAIAWMFPTGGRSHADPEAPVIGRRVLRATSVDDPELPSALLQSFSRVVRHLGLVERDGRLVWRAAPQAWAALPQRDWRVYRMLRCVHNAGLATQAAMLMKFLDRELGGDPARADALAWYYYQVAS